MGVGVVGGGVSLSPASALSMISAIFRLNILPPRKPWSWTCNFFENKDFILYNGDNDRRCYLDGRALLRRLLTNNKIIRNIMKSQNMETLRESIGPLLLSLANDLDRPACTTTCAAGLHQEQPQSQPMTTPDRFDVIGGRGQGVQRLPGNRRYRELVTMNKVR